jgi:uncharacterized protein
MEARITMITLGVDDLKKSYQFYKVGLGFPTTRTPEDGVIFFQSKGTCLALFPHERIKRDINVPETVDRQRYPSFTLSHNVRSNEEVDEVMALAEKFGANIVKPAQQASWGGYSGFFTDPDGYIWEVANAGFLFDSDGSLLIS